MSRSVSTEMKMRETAILFAKAEIYQPTNNPLAGKKRFVFEPSKDIRQKHIRKFNQMGSLAWAIGNLGP